MGFSSKRISKGSTKHMKSKKTLNVPEKKENKRPRTTLDAPHLKCAWIIAETSFLDNSRNKLLALHIQHTNFKFFAFVNAAGSMSVDKENGH